MVPPFVRRFLDIYFSQFTLYNVYNLSKIWKDCYNVWFNGFVSAPSVSSALLLLMPPISASEHAERVLSDYNIDSKLDWVRTSQLRVRVEAIVHFREVEKSRTKRAERAQQVESDSPRGWTARMGDVHINTVVTLYKVVAIFTAKERRKD